MSAEEGSVIESRRGAAVRHVDSATRALEEWSYIWKMYQRDRMRQAQYDSDPSCRGCSEGGSPLPAKKHKPYCLVAATAVQEERAARNLQRCLRLHPLWPWLSQFPGLGGAHVGYVIGRIGDPRRFPGQRCSEGHYLPPLYAVGADCPVAVEPGDIDSCLGDGAAARTDEAGHDDGRVLCPGLMLPPRPGSGTRSLWHWLGLAPGPDGRLMRKIRGGGKVSYSPRVRSSIMMPDVGIMHQIVRWNVPVYADVYREKKALLTARVSDSGLAIEASHGDAGSAERTTVDLREIDPRHGRPLRPFEAERIARVCAAKQFTADLLREWKGLVE